MDADPRLPREMDRRTAGRFQAGRARTRRRRDLARADPPGEAPEHALRAAGLLAVAAVPGRLPPPGDAGLAVVVRQEPEPRRGRGHADRSAPSATVRRGHARRGAERSLLRRVGRTVGGLPRRTRRSLGELASERLRGPDDRRSLRGRLRRSRHRPAPPASVRPRGVVGRVLRPVPRRTLPGRHGRVARSPRPLAARTPGSRPPAPVAHPLLRLERARARRRQAACHRAVRPPPARPRPSLPARAAPREARRVGAAARRRPPLGRGACRA